MRKISSKAFLILLFVFAFAVQGFSQNPAYSFTASATSGCMPFVTTFTNNTTDPNAYKFIWYFGNGNTQTTFTPTVSVTYTYTASGFYSPQVDIYDIGNNYLGWGQCNSGNINVDGVSINMPDSVCPGDGANFCPGGGQWNTISWNFGDGFSSTQPCTNHTYTSTTTYTVTMTANTTSCGNQVATKTIKVTPNAYPVANWWTNFNGSVCPNQQVQFQSNSASSYTWNFGDGGTSNIQNPKHAYTSTVNATYTVSLIVQNTCGKKDTSFNTITVSSNTTFPNDPGFELNLNGSPGCPNSEIGFNAPDGYVTYVWNFGDGSPVQTSSNYWNNHNYGSAIANYTVSVKITNACNKDTTLYDVVQIVSTAPFPNQSWFKLQGSPTACKGDPAQIEAPGGYESYVWNFGDGGTATTTDSRAEHSYTATGTYTISCLITNGCGEDTTLYGSILVDLVGSFPNYINIDMSPSITSCPNDMVAFRINTGEYASYLWDFGDGVTSLTTGREIQHTYTLSGNYQVSCKITNGCALTTTVYATMNISGTSPIDPNFFITSTQNPACPGDDVFIDPHEGLSSYQYIWNFGDGSPVDTTIGTGAVHSYTAVGNYSATVTAKNGCGLTKTVGVVDTINLSNYPSLLDEQGDPIWGFPGGDGGSSGPAGCAGDAIIFYFKGNAANNVWNFGDGNSGTATEQMVVSGGDGGSFPVTIIKYSYAANGTYTVSLTLTNGCGKSTTGSMVITIGGNLLVQGDIATSPPPFTTCAPIDFIGFGGATYAWDFGDGTNLTTTSPTTSHTFSSAGVYVVSAVITNGCGNSATYSKSVNVSGVGGPTVVLSSSVTPTCVNSSNGSVTVNVTSGQMPYTYLWDDASAQTTSTATGLSSGQYNVIATDGFGCPTNLVVNLSAPAPIQLSVNRINTACGLSSGSATVTVTGGGTAPYSYLWSTGATTTNATGLGFGQYSVIVSDVNGCSATGNASVSEVGGPTLSTVSTVGPICNGTATGSISLVVSGGTPPYTYSWSNGATTQNISGVTAGSYSVLITDGGGCFTTYNEIITEPLPIAPTTSVVKSPTCGNFDGKASASGSAGPYTYMWDASTGNQTTQVATGLPAGTYSVTLTNLAGCTAITSISLNNSNAPVLSAVVSDVSCFGGSNGSVNLSVAGGTAPYLYTWNVGPPQTNNQDVFGLTQGSYFVSVNDSKGCLSFQLYTIAQPAVLTVSVTNTGATCGNNDGTATATPSGGNTTYSYAWTGGQTSQTATGLALGNYSVTVTDNKGCSVSSTTSVTATVNPIDICGVTVDATSTKNVIVWEKPVATNIDSFRIYRNIASVYTYVGAVAYQDSSYFVDNTNGVNPKTTSYRYKIKALDNCGNESVISDHHQTIHLAVSVAAPPNSFNLIWTDYLGFPVTQYRILVDSLNDGNWKVRDSVPYGNPKQWTDIYHYPNDTVGYMIEIAHPTGCIVSSKNPDPMAANLNLSKSNINKIADSTGTPHVANIKNELAVSLYPNPSSGLFTIDIRELLKGSVSVKVFNMLGEELSGILYARSKNKIMVDMSRQSSGVYYVHISNAGKMSTKKIIID